MGFIKGVALGKFTGLYKDVIVRIRNGKMVFYNKPESRKDNKTEKVLNSRGVFTYTVKFAAVINAIPLLKEIWFNEKKKELTAYSKIFKYNMNYTNPEYLTVNNKLVPRGYNLQLNDFDITKSSLSFNYSIPLNADKDFPYPYIGYIVINTFSPIKKSKKVNTKFIVYDKYLKKKPAGKLKMVSVKFDADAKTVLSEFNKAIVFVVFISEAVDKKKVYWTNTFAKEFDISKL